MLTSVSGVAAGVARMDWTLLAASSEFITSDRGLAMWDPELLSCASTTTALEALAAAADVPPHDVHTALTAIDWPELEQRGDPARALPQLAAERLGRHLGGFSEVRCFHGTRTRAPAPRTVR